MLEDNNNSKSEMSGFCQNILNGLTTPIVQGIGNELEDRRFLFAGDASFKAKMKHIQQEDALEKYRKDLADGIKENPYAERLQNYVSASMSKKKNNNDQPAQDSIDTRFSQLVRLAYSLFATGGEHGEFVEIIKHLTPYDVMLLIYISGKKYRPIATISPKGAKPRFRNLISEDTDTYPADEQERVVKNLRRLKLIRIDYSHPYKDESLYEPFRGTKEYKNCQTAKGHRTGEAKLRKGKIHLTFLCMKFLGACKRLT